MFRSVLVLFLLWCSTGPLQAQVYTWHGSTSDNGGLGSNWLASSSWTFGGTPNTVWNNSGSSTAIFDSSYEIYNNDNTYLASLRSDIENLNVNGYYALNFSDNGNILVGAFGGNVNYVVNIKPAVTGSNLSKSGPGQVNFYAVNTATEFYVAAGSAVGRVSNSLGTNLIINNDARATVTGQNTYASNIIRKYASVTSSILHVDGGGSNTNWTGNVNMTLSGNGANFLLEANYAEGPHSFVFNGGTITMGSGTFTSLSANVNSIDDANHQATNINNATFTGNQINFGRGSLGFANSNVTVNSYIASISDWAALYVNSGTVTVGLGVDLASSGVIASQIELNGGVLTTPYVRGNNYGGGTHFYFNGGTLKVGANNVDLIRMYANGSTIDEHSGYVEIKNGGAFIDTNGNNASIVVGLGNAPGHSGSLTKLGAGTLTLANSNSYTGGTNIQAGTLTLYGAGTLGASGTALNIDNGATLDLGGKTQTVGQVNSGISGLNGTIQNGTLTLGADAFFRKGTISAKLAGAAPITINGATGDVVTFSNNQNAYMGTLTITGGTLAVSGGNGTLGTGSNAILMYGGTLNLGGGAYTIGALGSSLAGNSGNVTNGTLDLGSGNGYFTRGTVSAALESGGTMTIQGGSGDQVTFSAYNNLFGPVVVSGGTLRIQNARALGDGGVTVSTKTTVLAAGTLAIDGSFSIDEHIHLGGTLALTSGNSSITSSLALDNTGSKMTTMNVATGSTLTLNTFVYSDSGVTAGINKTGGGTLVLSSGGNAYAGTTVLAGGRIIVAGLGNYNNYSSLGYRLNDNDTSDIGILFRGGTLRYEGSTATSTNRAIRLGTAGGTLDASGATAAATMSFTGTTNPNFFENPGTRTFTLTGTNTGANTIAFPLYDLAGTTTTNLYKDGTGTWVLSGTNTHAGTSTVHAGTLQVGTGANVGTLGSGGITIDSGATLRFYRSDAPVISNIIAGTGSIVLDGTTSATVQQQSSYQFTGQVTLSGTIQVGGPNGDARYYRPAGNQAGSASIIVLDGSTYFIADTTSANAVTLNGIGWNEAAGYLGALRLQTASQSGPVTLATTSRVGTWNGTTGTISGQITGSGGLEKYGTGTLTLSNTNNAYTGGTTVTQGVLSITGMTPTSGAVTVNNGGTLEGTGTIRSALTINASGTLRGGVANVGTLNLAAGLTMVKDSILSIKLASAGSPGSNGSSTDLAALPNPTRHNFLNITGGTTSINNLTKISVDLSNLMFTDSLPYSYQIASGAGNQSTLLVPDSQFTFTNGMVLANSASLTGSAGGAVYLNFTPLPEPGLLTVISGLFSVVALRRLRRVA